MINELTDRLAVRAKNAYCAARMRAQRIDHYSPGDDKYGNFWMKIAQICLNEEIEPETYIEVLFSVYKPWPHIQYLVGQKAIHQFYESRQSVAEDKRMVFEVQKKTFKRLTVELGHPPLEVLNDDRNRFDPLFSYIAALAHSLFDLCRALRTSAIEAYVTSDLYDEIYGAAIPAEFRRIKQELRKG